MHKANPRHTSVFGASGSLNQNHDINVNTRAPTENPISLEGHSCPSKCATKCFTDCKYSREIGNPITPATI